MLAVTATSFDDGDPLAGLRIGDVPDPFPPHGWVVIDVKAAALNHHDLWSLRGVGLRPEQLPMILGCDAAGIDDRGNEVIVYPMISDPEWRGDETLDPDRSMLSERYPGTLARRSRCRRGTSSPNLPACPSRRRRASRPRG